MLRAAPHTAREGLPLMLLDMSSTSTMSSGGRRTVGRPGRTVRVVVTSHTRVLRVRLLLPALLPALAAAAPCRRWCE